MIQNEHINDESDFNICVINSGVDIIVNHHNTSIIINPDLNLSTNIKCDETSITINRKTKKMRLEFKY